MNQDNKCLCHQAGSQILCLVGCCTGAGKTIQQIEKKISEIKNELSIENK